jgi:uncharacterized protein
MTSTYAATPLAATDPQRFALIDVLRGVALLGILLVNFPGAVQSSVDTAVARGIDLFVYRQFYSLFPFLFGLGCAIQLARWKRQANPTELYVRRMVMLFLIGMAHSVFIWSGDILVAYALIGLMLLPLQRVPPRGLLALIVILVVLLIEQPRIWSALEQRELRAEQVEEQVLARALYAERRVTREQAWFGQFTSEASYVRDTARRWSGFSSRIYGLTQVGPLLGTGDGTFGGAGYYSLLGRDLILLFVLGFYVGRKRWLERLTTRRHMIWILLVGGALAATASSMGAIVDLALPEFDRLVYQGTKYGLTLLYVGIVGFLLTARQSISAWLDGFAAAGTMALTTYLTQSLVMTWLFLPYGIGLPRLSYTAALLANITFFFYVQVAFSQWWLRRYHYGPAEWLWRSLTYGQVESNRRLPENDRPITGSTTEATRPAVDPATA